MSTTETDDYVPLSVRRDQRSKGGRGGARPGSGRPPSLDGLSPFVPIKIDRDLAVKAYRLSRVYGVTIQQLLSGLLSPLIVSLESLHADRPEAANEG